MVRRMNPGWVRRTLLGVAGALVILATWQIAAKTGFVDATRTSMPTAVIPEIPGLLGSADFRSHLGETLTAWGLAMAMMIAIAVPIGLAIGSLPALRVPTMGLVHVFRSIPSTALIPVAILYFGLGLRMKVMLVAYAITWPLLLKRDIWGTVCRSQHALGCLRPEVARVEGVHHRHAPLRSALHRDGGEAGWRYRLRRGPWSRVAGREPRSRHAHRQVPAQ